MSDTRSIILLELKKRNAREKGQYEEILIQSKVFLLSDNMRLKPKHFSRFASHLGFLRKILVIFLCININLF